MPGKQAESGFVEKLDPEKRIRKELKEFGKTIQEVLRDSRFKVFSPEEKERSKIVFQKIKDAASGVEGVSGPGEVDFDKMIESNQALKQKYSDLYLASKKIHDREAGKTVADKFGKGFDELQSKHLDVRRSDTFLLGAKANAGGTLLNEVTLADPQTGQELLLLKTFMNLNGKFRMDCRLAGSDDNETLIAKDNKFTESFKRLQTLHAKLAKTQSAGIDVGAPAARTL